MSEICPECLSKLLKTDNVPRKYVISRELDICEECGALKPAVIRIRRYYLIKEWLEEVMLRLRTEK